MSGDKTTAAYYPVIEGEVVDAPIEVVRWFAVAQYDSGNWYPAGIALCETQDAAILMASEYAGKKVRLVKLKLPV